MATWTIQLAGNNSVAVQKTIDSSPIIHAAVDNYRNEEGTSSGIGAAKTPSWSFFQITENNQQIRKASAEFVTIRRSLKQMLVCQNLERGATFTTRAEISEDFEINKSYNFQRSSRAASMRYKAWILYCTFKDVYPFICRF